MNKTYIKMIKIIITIKMLVTIKMNAVKVKKTKKAIRLNKIMMIKLTIMNYKMTIQLKT